MDFNKYYTVQDVAEMLNVSRNTVLNFKSRSVEKNPLVFLKIGNQWRISKEKLNEWIAKEQKTD